MVEWPLSNRASASLLGYTLDVTFHQNRHINERDYYSIFVLGFDERILYTFNQHTSEIHHQWPFHLFFLDPEMVFFDAHPCHTVPCMLMFVMNRFHIFIITVTWKVNLLNEFFALTFDSDFDYSVQNYPILTIQCRIIRLYYRECSTKMLSYIVMCARDIRSKTLWPRQNGGNCTDDTFKFIWSKENINCWFLFHWTSILGVQLTISQQIMDWTATSHFLNLF